ILNGVSLLLGVCLGWAGNYYFYQRNLADTAVQEDLRLAHYVVGAMLNQHPVKDSRELDERVGRYLDALRRTKADKRGVPVYRADGTIAVDWAMSIGDTIRLNEGKAN
ncbi:MAG: hypothetical protein WEG40_12105, partial [Candidatus Rokuibacteriota bacterium]